MRMVTSVYLVYIQSEEIAHFLILTISHCTEINECFDSFV